MRGKVKDSNQGYSYFATVNPNGNHSVYLSAYGQIASTLLQKYVEDQRADNEELFDEWDKSVKKAGSEIGFSAAHKIEDGYIYISSFQDGIGMPESDEDGSK